MFIETSAKAGFNIKVGGSSGNGFYFQMFKLSDGLNLYKYDGTFSDMFPSDYNLAKVLVLFHHNNT